MYGKRLLISGFVTIDSIALAVAEQAPFNGTEVLVIAFPRDLDAVKVVVVTLPRSVDATSEEDLAIL